MTTWQSQYIPPGDGEGPEIDPPGWYVRTPWDQADRVRMVLSVHSEDEAKRVARWLNDEAEWAEGLLGHMQDMEAEIQAARPHVTWHCESSSCHRGHDSDDVHGFPHPRVCLDCSTEEHEVLWHQCDLEAVPRG